MLKVGLTGGIGAGKSEVSRLLDGYGAVIVDADKIAREVVAPGTPGLAAVVEEFGEEILAPDGSLDRPRLGSVVFADTEKLAALNAIIHPLVGERSAELERQAEEAEQTGTAGASGMSGAGDAREGGGGAVLVHDVPLLAENGLAPLYDLVLVVDASPATQLDRLVQQRGMEEDEATARMAAQATREERLALADIVIRNDGSRRELEARVREVWEELRRRA
ncbi:dephospho-CoA kinase [Streptomyces sp. WMMB 322]|uniref:dephospho-CoA kinase n=1 Tax=Streptomyces sp. WMMB 322 TaxID=1286821 RepID=UPI0006E148D3|nr:dephospho-CoA kinase [Streptomyces sp. WMMB 322]SCK23549.1 dephospho-CoA kinase [Streptomyces sp. WMMB 322]